MMIWELRHDLEQQALAGPRAITASYKVEEFDTPEYAAAPWKADELKGLFAEIADAFIINPIKHYTTGLINFKHEEGDIHIEISLYREVEE